jgi:Site-specific recombinase XerD
MQLRQFEERENSKAVWLNDPEMTELIGQATEDHQRFALGLMGRSGLRVSEAIAVVEDDLIETEAGKMVRVWSGKGDKYREAPVTEEVFWMGKAMGRGMSPIIRHAKRTVQSWVEKFAGEMFLETEDVGWTYVSAHDLRRSWATMLIQAEVEPLLVMEYGGWSSWEVFRDHYMDIHSPDFQRQEREKVPWL